MHNFLYFQACPLIIVVFVVFCQFLLLYIRWPIHTYPVVKHKELHCIVSDVGMGWEYGDKMRAYDATKCHDVQND